MNINLILEEIYGNMATVYHYSPTDKTGDILKNREWKFGKNAGNMYGPGVYTCFKPESTNPNYGGYLYKFHVKGIHNFFIFIPEYCNKINGTHFKTEQECIEYQNKKFNLNVKSRMDFANKYKHSPERKKIGGIVFEGGHDGYVCLIFNPQTVIPAEFSRNNGRTWEKIDKNKNYNRDALAKGGAVEKSSRKEYESGTTIKKGDYTLRYFTSDKGRYYVVEKGENEAWKYYTDEGAMLYYKDGVSSYTGYKQLSEKETIKTLNSFPDWIKGKIKDKNLISVVKGMKMLEKEDERYNKEKSEFEKKQEEKRSLINKRLSKTNNRRLNELMPKSIEDWLKTDAKLGPEKKLFESYGAELKTTYREIKNFSADFISKSGTDLIINGKTKDDIVKKHLYDITDTEEKTNPVHKVISQNEIDSKYGYRTRAFLFNTDGAKYIYYMKGKEAVCYDLNDKAKAIEIFAVKSVAKYIVEHGEDTKYVERSNAKYKTKIYEYPPIIKVNDWLSIRTNKNEISTWVKEHKIPKFVGVFLKNGGEMDVPYIHCIDLTKQSVDKSFDNMYVDLVDDKLGLTEEVVKQALYKIAELNVKAMKYMKENNQVMKEIPLTKQGRAYKKKIDNFGRKAVRSGNASVKTYFNY